MANFWDELNARAQQQANQGANHSWEAYSKLNAQQTPAKPKKGFWADQISTGGGIGGALAGGAAGAALGSAVPVVGTAIGGLLGAILGGGLGSAGGEATENVIQGDDISKNVLKEGLIGGVTSLPVGAGLKLARAGGTALTGIGKASAGELIQEAGVQTIGKGALGRLGANGLIDQSAKSAVERVAAAPSLASKLGGRLNGAADDLAIKQFRFTPTQLKNFKAKFGEDAGQTVRKYGFSNVDDIAANGIDPLQSQFDNIVTNVGQVPADTIRNNFQKEIGKLSKSAVSDNRALSKQLSKEADGVLAKYGDSIDAKELNNVRREFDKLVNYTNSVADPARYGVNKRVADVLRKSLQESDNSGALKATGKELQKLRQLADNAAQQEQLGRGSLPFGLGLAPGAVLGASGGPVTAAAGIAAQAAVNSKTGRSVLMNGADKAASKLSGGASREAGQTLQQALTRMGGIGAVRSLGGQGDQSSLENSAMAPNTMSPTTNVPMASNMGQQYTQPDEMSNPLGVSSVEVGQALMKAYAAGDAPAIKQLEGMYTLASEYEKSAATATSTKGRGVEATKNANNASAGLKSIDDLESLIDSDSGIVSRAAIPDIAPLNSLLGTSTYRAAIKNAQDTMSRLRSGASMTEQEAARFDQMLPRLGDDPETIKYKLNEFRNYFNSYIEDPGTTSTTDLLSALQANQ